MFTFLIAHGFQYVYIQNPVPSLDMTPRKLMQPILHEHFWMEMNEFFSII